MVMRVVFHLLGYVRHDEEQRLWISYCPPLDQWSQAETMEDAKTALRKSVTKFLCTCYKNGTLEYELKNAGLEMVDSDTETDLRNHVANPLMKNPLMDAFGEEFDFEASLGFVPIAAAGQ